MPLGPAGSRTPVPPDPRGAFYARHECRDLVGDGRAVDARLEPSEECAVPRDGYPHGRRSNRRQLQAVLGWRDPDSNRGHHDFQSWSASAQVSSYLQVTSPDRGGSHASWFSRTLRPFPWRYGRRPGTSSFSSVGLSRSDRCVGGTGPEADDSVVRQSAKAVWESGCVRAGARRRRRALEARDVGLGQP